MTKLIAKTLLLTTFMITGMSVFSCYLDRFFTKTFKDEKPFWFLNKSNNTYDFAVIGSSRAENLVDINTMEKATNLKGINLAMQGTGNAGLYLLLKGFIERNNKIRYLLIQVDEYSLDSKKSYINAFPTHAYLPYFAEKSVKQIIRENVDYKKYLLWEYVPFSRYVDYNSYYMTYCLNFIFGKQKKNYEQTKGTDLEYSKVKFKFDKDKYSNFKRIIDKNDITYLNRIIEYANSNHISVIMFTAPQYFEIIPYLNTRDESLRIFQNIANRHQIKYLNFETDEITNDITAFFDATHLNGVGSKKFSENLSNVIKH